MTEGSVRPIRMGPFRMAVVAALMVVVALGEYDLLTTPWWQLTARICGEFGVIESFSNWIENLL